MSDGVANNEHAFERFPFGSVQDAEGPSCPEEGACAIVGVVIGQPIDVSLAAQHDISGYGR